MVNMIQYINKKRRLGWIKPGRGQGQGGGMNVIISRSYFLKEKTNDFSLDFSPGNVNDRHAR